MQVNKLTVNIGEQLHGSKATDSCFHALLAADTLLEQLMRLVSLPCLDDERENTEVGSISSHKGPPFRLNAPQLYTGTHTQFLFEKKNNSSKFGLSQILHYQQS